MRQTCRSRALASVAATLWVFGLAGGSTVTTWGGMLATAHAQDAIPGVSDPQVAITARIGENHSRLIFGWGEIIDYRVDQADNRVTVRFGTPGVASLERIRRLPLTNISDVRQVDDPDALAVQFDVAEGTRIQHGRSGGDVVVEFLNPQAASGPLTLYRDEAAAPTPANDARSQLLPVPAADAGPDEADGRMAQLLQPETAPPAPMAGAAADPQITGRDRLEEDEPASVDAPSPPPLSDRPDFATTTASATVADDVPLPGRKPSAPVSAETAVAEAEQSVPPQTAEESSPAAEPDPPSVDAADGADVPMTPAAMDETEMVAGEADPEAAAAGPADDSDADADADAFEAADSVIRLDLPDEAPLAVYTRAGMLWLAVATDDPSITPQVEGRTLGAVERVTLAGNATVFGFDVPDDLAPAVRGSALSWEIALMEEAATPRPIDWRVEAHDGRGTLRALLDGGESTVIAFDDPEVGDRLLIAPSWEPARGVASPRRLPEARILTSAQGVVVRPVADGVTLEPTSDGVVLTAERGLALSEQVDIARSGPQEVEPPDDDEAGQRRLFAWSDWRPTGSGAFVERRQAIQHAIGLSAEEDRSARAADLARLYLARGMGQEALGVLTVTTERDRALLREDHVRALKGAARILARQYEAGLEDLDAIGEPQPADIGPWRAFALARMGEDDAAHQHFGQSVSAVLDLPQPIIDLIGGEAIEVAIRLGDVEIAGQWLDRLEERGVNARNPVRTAYQRGHVLALEGRSDAAQALWGQAMNSRDRHYAVRAELADIEEALGRDAMETPNAINRLERLRFGWRGDDLELAILQRLGDLYLEEENYRRGFTTMRQAVSYFPDAPVADQIADTMSDHFRELFLHGGADSMPAVSALALYQDFSELTPVGREGDLVIQRLAERLVEVDLLDRAAMLLTHQVNYRLSGEARARVGTRLAAIRLLDGDAERAIEALASSAVEDMSDALVSERRLLEARALSDTGAVDDALALLETDMSEEADRLRTDIAWRHGRWADAARYLDRLMPRDDDVILSAEAEAALEAADADARDPEAVDPAMEGGDHARLIMNQAVALSLAGDRDGLEALRERYQDVMTATDYADGFAVLTRAARTGGLPDLETIRAQMAEVELFQNFLESYRDWDDLVTTDA